MKHVRFGHIELSPPQPHWNFSWMRPHTIIVAFLIYRLDGTASEQSRLSFSTQICTILTSRGFEKKHNKVAPSGNWTHSTNHHWIRFLVPCPTQPICHSLPVWDFQTLVKLCWKGLKFKKWNGGWSKIQFKDLLFNTCPGGRVEYLPSNP